MKDLPNIDPSLLTPHTKSDRNLPYRSVMTLAEIAAAEGGAPTWGFGRTEPRPIGESNDPKRPGPTCVLHWPAHFMDCQTCKDTCNRRIELNVLADPPPPTAGPHGHYFKDVTEIKYLDVYRVLALFAVTDPCLQHAVKKLLVAGGRGAGKDISQDVKEAIDTLKRWQEMRAEEAAT